MLQRPSLLFLGTKLLRTISASITILSALHNNSDNMLTGTQTQLVCVNADNIHLPVSLWLQARSTLLLLLLLSIPWLQQGDVSSKVMCCGQKHPTQMPALHTLHTKPNSTTPHKLQHPFPALMIHLGCHPLPA